MNVAARTLRAPPPPRLVPVRNVLWAEHVPYEPEFALNPIRNDTEARKAGRRYERHVQQHLMETFPNFYVPSPWVKFRDVTRKEKLSWCQPDGWLINLRKNLITIVEIKLKHTTDSWWQIRHLYEPVTRALFGPKWRYAACEVTKWYDPAIRFPENPTLTPELDTLWNGAFGIHIWSPT